VKDENGESVTIKVEGEENSTNDVSWFETCK
jgi:hypothetical protein